MKDRILSFFLFARGNTKSHCAFEGLRSLDTNSAVILLSRLVVVERESRFNLNSAT
jgi:hypothetical protein